MTAGSLYPAFLRIEYHSPYAPHLMTIPTLGWNDSGGTPASGEFDTWNAGVVEGDVMVQAFVDALEPLFTDDVEFDNYTIFTLATPTSQPLAKYAAPLTQVGTNVSTGVIKAVQRTLTFRTTGFNIGKIVLLDCPDLSNIDRVGDWSAISPFSGLWDVISDPDMGFNSRLGGRPNVAVQMSITLNEALRREYRMF